MAYPPAEHVPTRRTTLDHLRKLVVDEIARVDETLATFGMHAAMQGDLERLEGEKAGLAFVLRRLDEIEQRNFQNEMSEAMEQ